MKKHLFVLLALLLMPLSNTAQILNSLKDVVKPTEPSLVRSLNGQWDFYFINGTDWKKQDGFYQKDYDISSWDKIVVPGCWDALGYVEPKYANPENMNGLYRKCFTVPKDWKGKHVFISFDGVLRGYEVWINGKYVGKWESSYNTCHFDITDFLVKGENLLALRVYTHYKGFDFDGNDDWGQVGINRSVSMFAVPETHLKDFTLRTDKVSEESARINMTFDIATFTNDIPVDVHVEGSIKEPNGKIVARFKETFQKETKQIFKEITLDSPLLWNAETPNLYQLEYSLYAPKRVQHFTTRFGVREVLVDKNVIKLNGKKIKLRGVDLHETDPFHGKVVSEELNLKDLKMMEDANINFIRCSHYPRDPRFYELCDSIGMYVMDEVPFGYGDSHLYDKSYQDILLTRADATVRRDKNHPSVLFWSIGNENPFTPIAEETGRYVKQMDPTRPICYPMIHNYFLSMDFNIPDFVDVFAPHYPPVATLRYYAEAAKRPVILTEYCHSLGQSFEQHKELWELIEQNDNLAGGCVWEWVDQGMVDRKSTFPGKYAWTNKMWLKDSTCITLEGNSGADGMLYANRIPLSNYYELRKNYAQAPVFTSQLVGKKGLNHFEVQIGNRFDFIDLSDKVSFKWRLLDGKHTVSEGKTSIQCPSGGIGSIPIELALKESPADRFYHLKLDVYTVEGYSIGNYSIPIVSEEGHFMTGLFSRAEGDIMEVDAVNLLSQLSGYFQKYPLMRVGRKFSMSEELRAKGKAIDKYLIEPTVRSKETSGQMYIEEMSYTNPFISSEGKVSYRKLANGSIKLDYSLTPQTKGKLLLEGGLAFLLDAKFENMQWLGYGPYASYPGKQSANEYSVHTMTAGDLYFEGNRIGIDALVCTDSIGNGFAVIAPHSNMNFEQTDKGIVLSVNAVVAGLCGKLRETAYPIYTDDIESLDGSLVICPLSAGKWPEEISYLFKQANDIEKPENPFLSVYDTYLMKYSDIVN